MRTLTLRWSWFTLVKLVVYCLLATNLMLFIVEDSASFARLMVQGVTLTGLVAIYAQSIDTGAWLGLLFLFELETAVIPDARLTRHVERALHVARGLCGALILYAFYGYLKKALGFDAWTALAHADACVLGDGATALITLDEYLPLDAHNCVEYVAPLLSLAGTGVVATIDAFRDAVWLAWLDVVNAGAWILIVVMLEADVRIQESHRYRPHWRSASRWLKVLLYTLLFVAALLWGVDGDWLSFWDAFLWLFAFFCIELNVFAWSREEAGASGRAEPAPMR
ncbi:MAG: hypothetical protein H6993_07020 [Pseudomonadales bacterium]|nr:hypothetical protein [Pseudomonadales bacterium]